MQYTEQELEKRAIEIYDCERSPYVMPGWAGLTDAEKAIYYDKAKKQGECLFNGGMGKQCPLCGMLMG